MNIFGLGANVKATSRKIAKQKKGKKATKLSAGAMKKKAESCEFC